MEEIKELIMLQSAISRAAILYAIDSNEYDYVFPVENPEEGKEVIRITAKNTGFVYRLGLAVCSPFDGEDKPLKNVAMFNDLLLYGDDV